MRRNRFVTKLIVASLLLLPVSGYVAAQSPSSDEAVDFTERNLSGPRVGFSIVPGNGELRAALDKRGIGTVISQFGWHWEYLIHPSGNGPAFVTEFLLLGGGVEYGTLIPGATLALGVREPGGFEFGVGPNVIFGGEKGVNAALMIAAGKAFNFGGVSIPVNLAFVTSPAGNRLGFIVGYAIQRSSAR